MKKIYLFLSVVVMAVTGCQQAPKIATVDIEAEKAVIDSLFDNFNAAFSAKDVATLTSLVSEDALCVGTDPSEFWNKQQMKDMWTQMLADSAPVINYIDERKIKIAADGNSATVVEQYFLPEMSPKIPWRNAYHLVKSNGNWMILVLNCGFIPKNEDVQKLNMALE